MDIYEASRLLGSLRLGETVVLRVDGRDNVVTVQAEHRGEDAGCGSWDYGTKTKLGYGPGRWNMEVSAATLASGRVTVTRPVMDPIWLEDPCAGCGAVIGEPCRPTCVGLALTLEAAARREAAS